MDNLAALELEIFLSTIKAGRQLETLLNLRTKH